MWKDEVDSSVFHGPLYQSYKRAVQRLNFPPNPSFSFSQEGTEQTLHK